MSSNDPLVLAARLIVRQLHPYDRVYIGECDWGKGSKQCYAKGVHAAYRQLNSKWGMKIFTSKRQRDGNYDTHMILLRDGLGPYMGEKFSATARGGQRVYGFIMEHCPKVFGKVAGYGGTLSYRDIDDFFAKVKDRHQISDLHNGNCAITADGRKVVIDVSFNYVRNGEILEDHNDFGNTAGYWNGSGNSHKLENFVGSI